MYLISDEICYSTITMQDKPIESEYLTTKEVATLLRVKPATVADWCAKGKYPKKYLQRTNGDAKGSKWLIHKDALKPKASYKQIHTTETTKQSVAKALALFS